MAKITMDVVAVSQNLHRLPVQNKATLVPCLLWFQAPLDKTGILGLYCFFDCHLFSLLILLEWGQERELATISAENLCRLSVLSQE